VSDEKNRHRYRDESVHGVAGSRRVGRHAGHERRHAGTVVSMTARPITFRHVDGVQRVTLQADQ
jgi:hypothetical protein